MVRPPFQGAQAAGAPVVLPGAPAWLLVLPALACAAAGLALAWHHPLSPWAAAVGFAAAASAFRRWPSAWLVAVPAMLPLIDLAPWTGWITFEEFDLLVLAAAAGGYAWLAGGRAAVAAPAAPRAVGGAEGLAQFGLLLFAASVLWAMARGFADAGGFAFGWFQGYREPMNSLRSGKSLLGALLLLPLWNALRRRAPDEAAARLQLGLVLGLLGAALAALWERLAYTGLLNFSTDYRTTAMFWEMHVGGAAFDGFLALTLPFAAAELLAARSSPRWAFAAAVMLAAIYASLTTFSRGVYLALPIGAALTALLLHAQRRHVDPSRSAGDVSALWRAALFALGYALAAAWLFPTSGYRGLLALLGALALLLPLAALLRASTAADRLLGIGFGAVLVALSLAGTWLLSKGAYLFYAGCFALCAGGLVARRIAVMGPGGRWLYALAIAGYLGVLGGIALVGLHWGGEPALGRALPVALLLAVATFTIGARRVAPWPDGPRWQLAAVGAMVLAGAVVAAFNGGAYMSERFAAAGSDWNLRLLHWRQGLSMLETPEQQLFGRGMGRYFDNHWLEGPPENRPGDYRVHADGGNQVLALVAGRHMMGWGELLRVAQRVEPPVGPATLRLVVRSPQPALLHVDLCMKHLLYDSGCLVKQVKLAASPQWQPLEMTLDGPPLSRGDWYAPKLAFFSIATETPDVRVDVDRLVLSGTDGRNLLVNGDFEDGMARWFFTSDRNHMPWHIKSLFLHVLFEQGAVGLALWAGLVAGALWRLSLGGARGDPLAPPLAGAILGFVVVGAFDSLLDAPRVGLLFYLLLAIALARGYRRA